MFLNGQVEAQNNGYLGTSVDVTSADSQAGVASASHRINCLMSPEQCLFSSTIPIFLPSSVLEVVFLYQENAATVNYNCNP